MILNFRNLRRCFLVAAFLSAPALLSAGVVSETEGSIDYRQPDGIVVTVPKKPSRTIVAYASLAKVWELAGGRAVGVPGVAEKKTLPESMRTLPEIGSATMPDPEKILALKPDLVLLSSKPGRHGAAAELLRNSGIPAVRVEYSNYGDFLELLDFFRRITGTRGTDVSRVSEEVNRICAEAVKHPSPSCAVVFAASAGFQLESPGTNTGDMAERLGARNPVRRDGMLRVRFGYEKFLLENPDVILIVTMGDETALREKFRREFLDRPAWKTLSAAKNGRVHFLPVEWFLYTPGPDYPKAFRFLAELLYPGVDFGK